MNGEGLLYGAESKGWGGGVGYGLFQSIVWYDIEEETDRKTKVDF